MKQSVRTKNRLREHDGHGAIVVRKFGKVPGINGEAILFDCPCGWIGWLPTSELE